MSKHTYEEKKESIPLGKNRLIEARWGWFYLQQLNSSLQSAQSLCPSHLHFSLIHSPASQWNSPFLHLVLSNTSERNKYLQVLSNASERQKYLWGLSNTSERQKYLQVLSNTSERHKYLPGHKTGFSLKKLPINRLLFDVKVKDDLS